MKSKQTITASRDLVAIGVLAGDLQRSVREIEHAAEEMGLVAAMRLNHVVYFSATQVELLAAYFRRQKALQRTR